MTKGTTANAQKTLAARKGKKHVVSILPQPTESTCGPTCLQAVYSHFGYKEKLSKLVEEVPETETGGTFSVLLALHALNREFDTTIFSYNLRTFDPTWQRLPLESIAEKLEQRLHRIRSLKARANLAAYIEYLNKGGSLRFDELTPKLLKKILKTQGPIIAGLSSTHLYRDTRLSKAGAPDDVYGDPEGHFIVISHWDKTQKSFIVADPYRKNPVSKRQIYRVDPNRLINAIMLGIVTYDANLLVITPRDPTSNS